MTTILREKDVELRFDESWVAVKWDESEFRSRREQFGKAADVVASRASEDAIALFVFEAKDYPDDQRAVVPPPDDLAAVCAEKARDTLAQLLHSPPLQGRPSEDEIERLCRQFGATEHPLNFVLLVQDANVPGLDFTELQIALERALRWLPADSVAALLIDEPPWPDGLAIRRATPS